MKPPCKAIVNELDIVGGRFILVYLCFAALVFKAKLELMVSS